MPDLNGDIRLRLANAIANKLDIDDGQKDGTISGSVWNGYFEGKDYGMKMDEWDFLDVQQAVEKIKGHLSKLSELIVNALYREMSQYDTYEKVSQDEDGNKIVYEYDNEDNLIKTTHYKTESVEFYDEDDNLNVYEEEVIDYIFVFGKDNSIVKYSAEGDIENRYEYDEDNSLAKLISYGYNGEINQITEYYKNGKVKRITEYNSNGVIDAIKEYDDDGKINTITNYDLEGQIASNDYYHYDNNGKLSKVMSNDAEGKKIYIIEYNADYAVMSIYDSANGRLTSHCNYNKDNQLMEVIHYASYHRIDYRDTYNEDQSFTRISYYNDGTRYSEEKYDSDGKLMRRTMYYNDGKTPKLDQNYENGVWTITDYNEIGQITSKKTEKFLMDGNVGDSAQKLQGDCYLMASINAIRQTNGGQNYLNSLIKREGENYVVTLPGAKIAANGFLNEGVPKDKMFITGEYIFTPEEMEEIFNQSGSGYSYGDNDTILIEAAFEKYRLEVLQTINANKEVKQGYTNMAGEMTGDNEEDILGGGFEWDALFILTGQKSFMCRNYLYKEINNKKMIYDDYPRLKTDSPSFTGSSNSSVSKTTTVEDIDTESTDRNELKDKGRIRRTMKKLLNKIYEDRKQNINKYIATASFVHQNSGGHAYTIKTVTEDSVVLINPWYPDKTTTMRIEDFLKKVRYITITELP